jgi:hypothetical protein
MTAETEQEHESACVPWHEDQVLYRDDEYVVEERFDDTGQRSWPVLWKRSRWPSSRWVEAVDADWDVVGYRILRQWMEDGTSMDLRKVKEPAETLTRIQVKEMIVETPSEVTERFALASARNDPAADKSDWIRLWALARKAQGKPYDSLDWETAYSAEPGGE